MKTGCYDWRDLIDIDFPKYDQPSTITLYDYVNNCSQKVDYNSWREGIFSRPLP